MPFLRRQHEIALTQPETLGIGLKLYFFLAKCRGGNELILVIGNLRSICKIAYEKSYKNS
jgi:hypothetical protein